MNIAVLAPQTQVIDDDDVLVAVRGYQDQITDAELGLINAALEWAHRNPGEFIATPERWWDPTLTEHRVWEDLADHWCVLVDEMSIPEFADAAVMSLRGARSLIRDAIVMFYRYPKTWARMNAGHVKVWQARFVPRFGVDLPLEAARFVDSQLDQVGARHSMPGVEALIHEARLRYLPEEVAGQSAAQQHLMIDTRPAQHTGHAQVAGVLDLPDALDLESAIAFGARRLKDLGSTDSLDLRRAQALGDLARTAQGQLTLNEPDAKSQQPDERFRWDNRLHWDGTGAPATGVKLYIHFNHTALRDEPCRCTTNPDHSPGELPPNGRGYPPPLSTMDQQLQDVLDTPAFGGGRSSRFGSPPRATTGSSRRRKYRDDRRRGETGRVEGTGVPYATVLAPEQIRSWFTRHTTADPRHRPKIIVRPVIDLHGQAHGHSYHTPERIREHVYLRDVTCVFPYCDGPGYRADCDHVTPWDEGGVTCTCNLALLCRSHHRLKTHGQHHGHHQWRYTWLGEGKYVWIGPGGIRLLRDQHRTVVLSEDRFALGPEGISDPGRFAPGVRTPEGGHGSRSEDDPAFDTVTNPLALPRSNGAGEPVPVDENSLLRDVVNHRGYDRHRGGRQVRFSARGEDPQPRIIVYPEAGVWRIPTTSGTTYQVRTTLEE